MAELDAEAKFALELSWCIQKLSLGLSSGKLSQKQKDDTAKTIRTLQSNKQPVIKKRQLMRATFGDYRAKMAEDEKKLAIDPSKVQFKKPPSTSKSQFLRKSTPSQTDRPAESSEFKFSFNVVDPADGQ